jgi:hypothetical protein
MNKEHFIVLSIKNLFISNKKNGNNQKEKSQKKKEIKFINFIRFIFLAQNY